MHPRRLHVAVPERHHEGKVRREAIAELLSRGFSNFRLTARTVQVSGSSLKIGDLLFEHRGRGTEARGGLRREVDPPGFLPIAIIPWLSSPTIPEHHVRQSYESDPRALGHLDLPRNSQPFITEILSCWQTHLASDIPDYCVGVRRCIRLASSRSFSWHRLGFLII